MSKKQKLICAAIWLVIIIVAAVAIMLVCFNQPQATQRSPTQAIFEQSNAAPVADQTDDSKKLAMLTRMDYNVISKSFPDFCYVEDYPVYCLTALFDTPQVLSAELLDFFVFNYLYIDDFNITVSDTFNDIASSFSDLGILFFAMNENILSFFPEVPEFLYLTESLNSISFEEPKTDNADILELQLKIADLIAERDALKVDLITLNNHIKDLQLQLENSNQNTEQLTLQIENLNNLVLELNNTITQRDQTIVNLNQQIIDIAKENYELGYNKGVSEFKNALPSVFGSIGDTIKKFMSFEIWGMSLGSIFALLLAIGGVLFVLKIVRG